MISQKYDILSVGELLIDLISTDFSESFATAETFRRLPGGSPANLCMNMARLGCRSQLVSTVGADGFGQFLMDRVAATGVNTDAIRQVPDPTTLILVTRSKEVSAFEAYRMADTRILPEQFPVSFDQYCRLFHTTCFALSKAPAQTSIMAAARRAVKQGVRLSIDLNYAAKIWPERAKAHELVNEYIGLGALVKVSDVDWERLYEQPMPSPEAAANHFLTLGATLVCVTMGAEGCYVSDGLTSHRLPTRPLDVKDTTGAGDAFWSGFLCAYLDGHVLLHCAMAGRKMAETKIAQFGELPNGINKSEVYVDFAPSLVRPV